MRKIICLFCGILFSTSALAKDYKPFLCNYFVSSTLAKDNCQGVNSWYKVYFPDEYASKASCLRESEALFTNSLILEIFPDYQQSGIEIKSWISGCDSKWIF
jgi:hypothetical protein